MNCSPPPSDIYIQHACRATQVYQSSYRRCRARSVTPLTMLIVLASAKSIFTSHQAQYLAQKRTPTSCSLLTLSFYMML